MPKVTSENEKRLAVEASQQIVKRAGALSLSRDELAEEAGIARSTLYTIWNGQALPNIGTASKIADALQCEIGDIWKN